MNIRLLLVIAWGLTTSPLALAHGIGVEAKLKGDKVVIETFFDDDTPAADAKITVTAEDGKVVAQGQADSAGKWSFSTPLAGKYKVTVDAGDGHSAKATITIAPRADSQENAQPPANPKASSPAGADPIVSDGLTRAETTGSRRLWLAFLGVAGIGLMTWVFRLLTRRKTNPEAKEPT